MSDLRFPGQVPPPGWLMVCVKCGYIAEYDCNCDGPFDSRDWSDALHFDTVDDAKSAATAMRAEMTRSQAGTPGPSCVPGVEKPNNSKPTGEA